jgi:hypothetical protein
MLIFSLQHIKNKLVDKWLRSLFLYNTWSWSNGRWMLPMKSVSISTNVVSSNPTQRYRNWPC